MQLNAAGWAIISQLKQNIMCLKDEQGLREFILPSIDIFSTTLSTGIKEQLRRKLIILGMMDASYQSVIEEYQRLQTQYFTCLIAAIDQFLGALLSKKITAEQGLNKLLDFMSDEQLSNVAMGLDISHIEKINPAIKLRMIYFLIDKIYTAFCALQNAKSFILESDSKSDTIKKISAIVQNSEQNPDKRRQLYPLFFSELHIREASILASGERVEIDQLSDIFIVYKTAAYGISTQDKHIGASSYYNLAVKTLLQLSHASQLMQANAPTSHLSFNVNPIHDNTVMSAHGLVRSRCFGIQISHEVGETMLPLNQRVTQDYDQAGDLDGYRLSSALKIEYLSHIEQLHLQINSQPKHPHMPRRLEKLAALQAIVDADEQNQLSPALFAQVKSNKPYIFVAWWSSKTLRLIERAEYDLKIKMWNKLSKEYQSIGHYGYSINDEDLLATLLSKYQEFNGDACFDANKKISDFIAVDAARQDESSYLLWRYDKKMALEIILISHAQQLLHPALIKKIEENYPHVYARSLPFIRTSAVESIISAVKEHLATLFWADAKNDRSKLYGQSEVSYAQNHYL